MSTLLRPAALCALFALAACTSASAPARPHHATLHLITGADPPGFNSLVVDNANVTYFSPLIHGYLLRTDGAGRLLPDLAIAVPTRENGGVSADGRTVTYRLRRDARWHDGAPFDARDVVFSFQAAMSPRNAVPDRTGFDHVAAVRARDRYTVEVHLTRPFSPFVPSCFTLAANDPYPLLPAHLLSAKHDLNRDPYNAAPVGLGPYKLESWERGSRFVLTADPHYFGGVARIPRIDVAIVPDPNTAGTLWSTKAIDLLVSRVQLGRTFLDAVRRRRDAHVVLQPHYEFDFLLFNQRRPPLDDARVRRALVMAIDRKRIMRDLDGELWIDGESDRLPGQFAYDPALRQPSYDPAAAARLLDAAGWKRAPDGVRRKDGRVLAFDYVATTESKSTGRFGLFVQQELAALGARVELKSYNYNVIWASKAEGGVYQNGRFDLTYSGWQPNGVADHSYLFRCDTRPPNGDNLGGICDPVIERAAHEELDATDTAREASGDRALTRRLVERSNLLFLGFNREGVAMQNDLLGVVPSVTGEHLWNAARWHWRAGSRE